MKPFAIAVVFVSVLLQSMFSSAATMRALVYKGPGSCEDQCSESAAAVANSMGIQTRFVGPRDIRPEIFQGVHFWIQPGGNAITVVKSLKPAQLRLIREFVGRGGGYVGFCAGAFFADEIVDDHGKVKGLNILPAVTKDWEVESGENGIVTSISWRGVGPRDVFFNGGAAFLPPPPNSQMEILAFYQNREIAALHAPFGAGHISVAGFHPESPDSWKTDTGMRDRDGSDWELAQQMIWFAAPRQTTSRTRH